MTLWPLFFDGVQLPQGYAEPLRGDSLLFTRNFWYSLDQYRKNERLRCVSTYLIPIRTDSMMTLNCELFQSEFSVLSKICYLCSYVDQMIIQQRSIFSFKFNLTIFLLMFLPLFSNVSTKILKIYELPKICNKILKQLLTIIIYQVNSMPQLHLASEHF